MRYSSAIAAAALIAVSVSSAMAQSRVEIGTLECRGTTANFVVGSVTELRCMFRAASGMNDLYQASVRRVGLDIGTSSDVVVAWVVLAPTRVVGPGDLRGNYAGVAANAAIGVGLGANALVGGSNNTIALQPLSAQAQTGLNLAAGIASLELRPAR
jgi:hypothetical protein